MVSDDLSVILIESNQKKATFLAEVVRELQLTSVEVRWSRMDDISFDDAPAISLLRGRSESMTHF